MTNKEIMEQEIEKIKKSAKSKKCKWVEAVWKDTINNRPGCKIKLLNKEGAIVEFKAWYTDTYEEVKID